MKRKTPYERLKDADKQRALSDFETRLSKPWKDRTAQTLAFAKEVVHAENFFPKDELRTLRDKAAIDPGDWSRLKKIGNTTWLYKPGVTPRLPNGGEGKLALVCKLGRRDAVGLMRAGRIGPATTKAELSDLVRIKKGARRAPDGTLLPKLPRLLFAGVHLPRYPETLEDLDALQELLHRIRKFVEPLGGQVLMRNGPLTPEPNDAPVQAPPLMITHMPTAGGTQ